MDRKRQIDGLSPAALAALVKNLRQKKKVVRRRIPRLGRSPAGDRLSFAQERFWFLDRLHPGSATYNIAGAVTLGGELDVAALRASLDALVARHQTLRTRFAERDGSPVQILFDPPLTPLPVIDLQQLLSSDRQQQADRLGARWARSPFELNRGPLLRCLLLHVSARQTQLVLGLHHIIADGWSCAIMVREIADGYSRWCVPEPPADGGWDAELPIQYADFADWQRQRLVDERLASLLDFWQPRLQGVPVLDLPTDGQRSASAAGLGGRLPLRIDRHLTSGLETLAKGAGVTLFVALVGVFGLLLRRFSGQQDFAVATPTAGRDRSELEPLIGCFVNTLLLRLRWSDNLLLDDLLSATGEQMAGALEHQELPFEELVRELDPQRSMATAPLAQVMLVLQGTPLDLRLGDLSLTLEELDTGSAKFDLLLNLTPCSGRLEGFLEYRRELFDRSTVDRLCRYLEALIAAFVGGRGRLLSQLSAAPRSERQQLLYEWSEASTAGSPNRGSVGDLLHRMVAAQSQRSPTSTALIDGASSWSYAQLDEAVGQLASRLVGAGVEPGQPVAVCLRRSPEMVVCLLAVMRAGAYYVPLDVGYPTERLHFIVTDSAVQVVLLGAALEVDLPPVATTLRIEPWRLAELSGTAARRDRECRPSVALASESLAYVIYTSGSTGQPKGVGISHSAATGLMHWARSQFSDSELSGVLAATSICFDLSVFELFAPLCWGGCAVLAEDALNLSGLPAADRVRLINTVPSVMAAVLRQGPLPASVETINLAGEALSGALVAQVYAAAGVRRVLNLYGPSEDTTYSTATEVSRSARVPTIGRPLPATEVYLLDRRGLPVPLGARGELALGGAHLARGYLRRSALTAERFVPHSFSAAAGARLYLTGDQARYRGAGELDFLGRLDHQVKVRGFRIELGEVAARLTEHPAVEEVVAVVEADADGGWLIAFWSGRSADSPAVSGAELRAFLATRLPDFMVPTWLLRLAELPRTANGKIDRRALPGLSEIRGQHSGEYIAPRDAVERTVADIWCQVLKLERVGALDEFFALGGHSLLATRVVARVREAFGIELPLRSVFEFSTVERSAEQIRSLQQAPGELAEWARIEAVSAAVLPLSFAQERLWFVEQLEPGAATHNVPAAVRLVGSLDRLALHAALAAIIERHAILRTVVRSTDGRGLQEFLPSLELLVPLTDLSALDSAAAEDQLALVFAASAQRPFDLEKGPLIRSQLLRLASAEHVLLLELHHLITDAWSMEILIRELTAFYGGKSLPPVELSYGDFALWQRRLLDERALEPHLDYWRRQLAAIEPLELPTDWPRPTQPSQRGGALPVVLGMRLSAALEDFSRRFAATPFMVLLATFAHQLSIYSGRCDIAIGSPVAGRQRIELEEMIGFFVNTLVLRVEVGGDPTFRQLLGRVRELTLQGQEHQQVPFARLVEELSPRRDLGITPLFQVMLVLQTAPRPVLAVEGLELEPLAVHNATAPFELTLSLAPVDDGLEGTFEYAAELFSAATVARFRDHFCHLLSAVVEQPNRRLSELSPLAAGERHQVLVSWAGTTLCLAEPSTVVERIDAAVGGRQAVAAVVDGDQRLSYGELDVAVVALAQRLRRFGVGPEIRVAVHLRRSARLIVALLAVMKCGGAYVPLDPRAPRRRLAQILDDAGVALVLSESQLLGDLPSTEVPVWTLGALEEAAAVADERAFATVAPELTAYLIYTSGSSGRPKGVAISHRALASYVVRAAERYDLGEGDRVLQLNSISFDTSAEEIFPALLAGATLVPWSGELESAGAFLASCQRVGVTVLNFPTAYWHTLVAEVEDDSTAHWPAGLRLVIIGGEQALAQDLGRWRGQLDGAVRLLNTYGPTEATIVASWWEDAGQRLSGATGLPIGEPTPNARTRVLDRCLRPLPIGVPGELCIGGEGLARGYFGNPRLTAELFVPDPYSSDAFDRLYRTGDLVRFTGGGELEFVGRRDHQVKIRGFRVELGEIEAALEADPGVRSAVVTATPSPAGDLRLAAYVVALDSVQLNLEDLATATASRLPNYMLPSAWGELDTLPLLASGKVNRRALASPEWRSESAERVAPVGESEVLLARLFGELLEVAQAGANDDFFRLGGHSLLAIQLVSRVRAALAVELPVRQVFEHPRLADLARRLDVLRHQQAAVELGSIERRPDSAPVELSYAQQRLWFLDQLQPESIAYHVPVVVELEGALDVDALRHSLARTMARHSVLRTIFPTRGGRPAAEVAATAVLGQPAVDLTALTHSAAEKQAQQIVLQSIRRPFDLGRGLLWRTLLLRLGERRHRLILTLHHIVTDGWSMGILLRELTIHYAALKSGEQIDLPALPVSYSDYASWQRGWLGSELIASQLAYWKEALAGAPAVLDLPTDRPRPANPRQLGALHGFRWSSSLSDRLSAFGRDRGATLFMVLRALFQLLLARQARQTDLVIGSPVAGRRQLEVEGLIGLFVNLLPLRAELSGEPTFEDFLEQVRDNTLAAFTHQDLPFERLVDELQPQRDLSYTPIFQTLLVLQNAPLKPAVVSDLELRPLQVDFGIAKFDLTLTFEEGSEGLEGLFEYDLELFDTTTVERFASRLQTLCESALAAPLQCCGRLDLLPPEERRQLLAQTPLRVAAPSLEPLHQLFEAQAARRPDAVALCLGSATLTYRALDRRAERLAAALRGLGVKRGARVGIFLDRSLDLVMAILAVLKMGAAYVPLDPANPAERLAYLLQDSGLGVLLTQRRLLASLPESNLRTVLLDAPWPPPLAGGVRSTPEDAAYVIYTSGSTGKPKGVEVTHANVTRLLSAARQGFDFDQLDAWSLFHSCAFDFSVWELWGALAYGGRLLVVPYWTSRSPDELLELLARQRVTVLNQTPSAFRQLIRAEQSAAAAPRLALRWVIFGGEALELESLRPWFERHGEERPRLVNMFGITETTVHVTYRRLLAADLDRLAGASPIGEPLPDLRLHLLDGYLEPLPIGVVGELYVAGAGIARGYLERPALTAERLVPDPFSGLPGERLYRSGDLARRLTSGDLAYVGRADQQVKIRGFRIELGEIEGALLEHPAVTEAAVLALDGGDGSKLAAYVVATAASDDLRAHLLALLPQYMVPEHIQTLSNLPLTANGKLDQRRLPVPRRQAGEPTAAHVPPTDPLARRVAAAWRQVLERQEIGMTDSFFTLGGDSIKAVRLAGLLNEEFDAGFKVRDVFRFQTVGEQTERLRGGAAGWTIEREHSAGLEQIARFRKGLLADAETAARLPPDWADVYPLSDIEKSMVYYSLLWPEEPVYHDQFVYFVELQQPAGFFRALELLIDRHHNLRCSFDLYSFAEQAKVVHRTAGPQWAVEDLSALAEDAQRRRVLQYQASDLARRFSFTGDLMWRFKLFRLAGERHCVVWTFHHAILDGWSNISLWVELSETCRLADLETRSALPPLATGYRDYVAVTLGRKGSAETTAFWRRYLAGHERSKLPFNRARRQLGTDTAMQIRRRDLGGELLERLRRQAARYELSLQGLCLAAHVFLLHVLSSVGDLVTGVVSNDRVGLADGEKVLGCFLTTLPLRLAADRHHHRLELVREVERRLIDVKAHEIPLVEIAAASGTRVTSGNPLFDTLFNYMDFHRLEGLQQNSCFRAQTSDQQVEAFGLENSEMTNTLFDLEVNTTLGGLGCVVKFSPEHFEPADIEKTLDLYGSLLHAFAEDLGAPLDAEQLLVSSSERQQLVQRYNHTGIAYKTDQLLHQPFERSCARAAARVAVSCAGKSLSYGELENRANQLAHYLIERGVEPGDNVGLIYARSLELAVGVLAILKAGAAYVPIEPSYPALRKSYIVNSSGIRWLLAADQSQTVLDFDQLVADEVMVLVPEPQVLAACSPRIPEVASSAAHRTRQLAYTIYTSGSTGRPKGVMIEHQQAINLLSWVNRQYRVGGDDVLLMLSSVCFDLSVYDLFGGWAAGAKVVIAELGDIREPGRTRDLLDAEGVTFWNSVPSTLGTLVKYLEDRQPDYCNRTLRLVFLSGDWIPVSLPDRIRRFFSAAEVVSLGGATEATVWSIFHPIGEVDLSSVSIPYGRPLDNNTFFVLDRSLSLVPTGVVGDLYIGGVGVARGYAGDPRKTAQAFVPDRFAVGGERLYRTGDLGRMLDSGAIEFLGRADHQVKIRGFRVELGEIENTLLQHPQIVEAVVVVRSDPAGDKLLCAYLVARGGFELNAVELRRHLGAALPEYMIPATYVFLDQLPLNANNKLDRHQLPDPEVANLAIAARYVEPESVLESELIDIWQEVLGVDGIGTRHDFFELGGHSLSAVQVITRLRQSYGIELPLRELFDGPTVTELAARLGRLGASGARSTTALEIDPSQRPDPAPLSFSQERLWFIDQLEPGNPAYNISTALRLRGDLDLAALSAAFSEIVRRHEVLRTTYPADQGRPLMVIAEPAAVAVGVIDLGAIAADQRLDQARGLAQRVAEQPFDLARDSLLRVVAVRLAEADHVALLSMHHIVTDGWSMGILIDELGVLYGSRVSGREGSLPELPIQYADYAHWQRQRLTDRVIESQLNFWRGQLEGTATVIDLPTDFPRPAQRSSRGAVARVSIDQRLSEALAELGRARGMTTFMAVLAVLEVLLQRYSGQNDFTIGTPVMGRHRVETESLIGFLVNTLVLRADLSGQPTFESLLERVRRINLRAHEHQELPFEKLAEHLQPDRDLSRTPLFQVLFVLQKMASEEALELPGLTLEPLRVDTETAQFELTLILNETVDGLTGSLIYSTDLFTADSIERLWRHFESLARAAVENPATKIGDLALLSVAERQELLSLAVVRAPASANAGRLTLVELFARQVKARPDHLALSAGQQHWTYLELDQQTDQLAALLQSRGARPEVLIGLCCERGANMVLGILSILKAGAAYLPLDPRYPKERLRLILDDCRAPLLLSERAVAGDLPSHGAEVVLVDQRAGFVSAALAPVALAADHPVYVIYTSGSTGRPKGVPVSHRSVVRLFEACQPWCEFGAEEVWALFHSFAFDFSVWELWGALLHGGRVVVVPYATSRSADEFLNLLRREQVTVLSQTPSAFRQLIAAVENAAEAAEARGEEFSTGALRWVIFGGEALELQSLRPWFKRFGDRRPRLVNMYGITETTVHVTQRHLGLPDLDARQGSVIGKALDHLGIYLLDRHLQLLPRGVVGEIFVAGEGLSRGYLRRAGLTALRFVPHPYAEMPGERLYRSGDLARWRRGGGLEYLGRADTQVKIRGFRIELGEVEAVLAAHPRVRQALVLKNEFKADDARLVAYAVVDTEEPPTLDELLTHLHAQLPDYMVPAACCLLEAFPLTAHGKIDRGSLPEVETALVRAGGEAPVTTAEELLAGLWQELLGVEGVGRRDDFFDLGGHSLLATQLVSRLREVFAREVSVRQIFEHPRLVDLAASLEDSGVAERPPPIVRRSSAGRHLLSFPQQRFWLLEQLDPGSAAHNVIDALRLEGELDVAALGQALQQVWQRHEVLRVTFFEVDGRPYQRLGSKLQLTLPTVDLGGLDSADRQHQLRRWIERESTVGFDLGRGPLLRAKLIRLAKIEHVLLVNLHHIVCDGWSMGRLMGEVTGFYGALRSRDGRLPEKLPVSYLDYVAWQREWLDEARQEEQLDYWRLRLAGDPPPVELPLELPKPQVGHRRGAAHVEWLPSELSGELERLGRRQGATLFMTLLAAFKVLLLRASGIDDLVVGTNLANRNRVELEGLVGNFINMLALRSDLSGAPSFLEVLERVRVTALEAYAHQDVPYEQVLREVLPHRAGRGAALIRWMLAFEKYPPSGVELPELVVSAVDFEVSSSAFDLSLNLSEDGERGIKAIWVFDTEFFGQAAITALAQDFLAVLEQVTLNPERPVSEVRIVHEAPTSTLVDAFNDDL